MNMTHTTHATVSSATSQRRYLFDSPSLKVHARWDFVLRLCGAYFMHGCGIISWTMMKLSLSWTCDQNAGHCRQEEDQTSQNWNNTGKYRPHCELFFLLIKQELVGTCSGLCESTGAAEAREAFVVTLFGLCDYMRTGQGVLSLRAATRYPVQGVLSLWPA